MPVTTQLKNAVSDASKAVSDWMETPTTKLIQALQQIAEEQKIEKQTNIQRYDISKREQLQTTQQKIQAALLPTENIISLSSSIANLMTVLQSSIAELEQINKIDAELPLEQTDLFDIYGKQFQAAFETHLPKAKQITSIEFYADKAPHPKEYYHTITLHSNQDPIEVKYRANHNGKYIMFKIFTKAHFRQDTSIDENPVKFTRTN
jgi:hypothetical protein